MKVVIVGAGLASAIAVYLLKKHFDCDITIYEQKNIGGLMRNDTTNNITIQLYGPHVFHTTDNNIRNLMLEIFNHYNIKWETYYLQVFANVNNNIHSLPYSKMTNLSHDNYINKIIKPYTQKQWGKYNEDVVQRLYELDYYTGHYHTTATFSCIFDHNDFFNKIFKGCNIVYDKCSEYELSLMDADIKIYTGYRENCEFKKTLFRHKLSANDQGCLQMNYPGLDKKYTRVMDYCYLTNNPIKCDLHPICEEIPSSNMFNNILSSIINCCNNEDIICDDHIINTYPIGDVKKNYDGIVYLGRFGLHKYLDMDKVVASVLDWFKDYTKHN